MLGWTPPSGSRTGIGALHVGFYDPAGKLHYVGGVGTGFSEGELGRLREKLDALAADTPEKVIIGGDPLDRTIRWVKPELVAEVQYAAWSGSGRIRHAVYLGLREDKAPREVVRDIPDPDEPRKEVQPRNPTRIAEPARKPMKFAVPPIPPPPEPARKPSGRIVVAPKPQRPSTEIAGIEITHPDRALWPGITKRDLAEYWQGIADWALPGLAHRPLAILRCPEGIEGEHFFQKRGHNLLPDQVREGTADGSPYLAIDGLDGLIALAQMSAIELHPWGAAEADALHPDWIVFDLDPGEGVPFPEVVRAALDLRKRLEALGLAPFPRTTGGKGLHLVIPLEPRADWDEARAFCRAFAELMSEQEPDALPPRAAEGAAQGPHPHRLAPQRPRRHRRRLVLPARPPQRDRRNAARLARGDGEARPRRLHPAHHPRPPRQAEARPLGRLPRRRPPDSEGGRTRAEETGPGPVGPPQIRHRLRTTRQTLIGARREAGGVSCRKG